MDKDFEFVDMEGNIEGVVEAYELERIKEEESFKLKKKKKVPVIESELRHRLILVPEAIYECSGIIILGNRIKSILFTTDIALIRNNNADAVMCVYPFTPQLGITQAIIETASVPVFAGIGGGTTSGERSTHLGLQAELMGCYGVVVNAPMGRENIKAISNVIDIPLISTVVSLKDDYIGKIEAGAKILNVSGGKDTPDLVREIRKDIGDDFPIIATGGHKEENIISTIKAGANSITYTPPTTRQIFQTVMEEYREDS